jgi:murein endopeptidase
MIANLQTAIANFRQDLDFDGELVLADISRPGGGKFNPHKSHQQGRDIDIWLPTLRGVFKAKYLDDSGDEDWGRRPEPDEADWFATWGLIKALADTGAVQQVFLDIRVQDRVYNAAKLMGASDEELDELIQWPRKRAKSSNILQHSAAHFHHIHVRFKCAPWEKECRRFPVRGDGP